MNAPWNAPISDRFSSLCARVFSPAAAILESEKTLGTRLDLTRLTKFVSRLKVCSVRFFIHRLYTLHKGLYAVAYSDLH